MWHIPEFSVACGKISCKYLKVQIFILLSSEIFSGFCTLEMGSISIRLKKTRKIFLEEISVYYFRFLLLLYDDNGLHSCDSTFWTVRKQWQWFLWSTITKFSIREAGIFPSFP